MNDYAFYSGDAQWVDLQASGFSRIISSEKSIQQVTGDQALPTFGSYLTFRLPKQGKQFITKANITTTVSTVTRTGGTFARLVDAFGIFQFDRIELWFKGKQIAQAFPEVIWEMLLQHNNQDELGLLKTNLGIDSAANRSAAAAAAQTFTLELDEFFALFSIPLPYWLLGDQLELRFYFKSGGVNKLVQTDGTAPAFSYTDCKMNIQYVSPPEKVVKEIEKIHSSTGYGLFYYDYLRYNAAIGTGSAQYQYNLQLLDGKDVVYMNFMARLNGELNTDLGCNYTNPVAISSWALKSASNYIHGPQFDVTSVFYKQNLIALYEFLGREEIRSQNFYAISYSNSLHDTFGERKDAYTGSKSFTNVSDAQLTINFAANVAAAETLDIQIVCAKRLVIKNGEIFIAG